MHIVFRVDASNVMGTGHVMRCLTLANELKRKNAKIYFITRAHQGNMADYIRKHNFKVFLLAKPAPNFQPSFDNVAHAKWIGASWKIDANETIEAIGHLKPDWLIVDHYGLDTKWHTALRNHTRYILAIDDLADRKMACDMLLDQTYGRLKNDYLNIVGNQCRLLLGTEYVLLRQEFIKLRHLALKRRESFKNISRVLISMGGIDSDNATAKVLDGLTNVNFSSELSIDLIFSKYSPRTNEINGLIKNYPYKVYTYKEVNNMALHMLDADIAIGAGGTTTWERCYLGLPTIIMCLAKNQRKIAMETHKAGAAIFLGNTNHIISKKIQVTLQHIDNNMELMLKMSRKCFALVDGQGTTRTIHQLTEI